MRHPDGVPERLMREALDWLVDRLESGWATHAVLLADEGEQHSSSLMALDPGLECAQSWPEGCGSARAAIPGVRAWDWGASLTARR